MEDRAEGLGAAGAPGSRRAQAVLVRSADLPRRARSFVVDALSAWGWDDVEVAELLVSELASNAVQHTASDRVVVGARELGDGRVRIEVTNDGIGTPAPQPPDPGRIGGHGLAVVVELASGWGVRHDDGTTTVWFDLEPASLHVP